MTDREPASSMSKNKTTTIMTGAAILWECLEREGVKHVFGYPGGAILPAYDALKHSKIHHVLVRHEQGATHMADGYARASGEVGVARRNLGAGSDQHGHRNRHRHAGFLTDRLHHRTGWQQTDRVGRVSGNRHHRRDPADHQAQLSGYARERSGADDPRSFLCGALGPSRAGAGRYHQGCAAEHVRVRLGSGQAATAGLPPRPFARSQGV